MVDTELMSIMNCINDECKEDNNDEYKECPYKCDRCSETCECCINRFSTSDVR